ncbi:MAG: hypothetical protein ACREEY_01860, partial [Brevundimonas sp.]
MSDADDQSTPFARRPVQWGRPPQTTFIAGPLPRGTGLLPPVAPTPRAEAPKPAPNTAPRPAVAAPAAPRPVSGNVLGGSLVPQRRAAQPAAAPNFLTAPMPGAAQPQPQPPQQAQSARAAAPVAASPAVDATPRPLPQAAAPIAARASEPAPKPAPPPRAAPQVKAAPVAVATSRKGVSRTPLYIAAAAVVVIGAPLATWLITRANSDPAPAAPSAAEGPPAAPMVDAAPPLAAPVEAAPTEAAAAPVARPAPR